METPTKTKIVQESNLFVIVSYVEAQSSPIISEAPPTMRTSCLVAKLMWGDSKCRHLLGGPRVHHGWPTMEEPFRWHQGILGPIVSLIMPMHLHGDANGCTTAETHPFLMIILESSHRNFKYVINVLPDVNIIYIGICAIGQIAHILTGKVQ